MPEDLLYMDNCGTKTIENGYLWDEFYGNNQQLLDILLKHDVNIDQNYLENLEGVNETPFLEEGRFAAASPIYYIPVKAWIYRNNNGTGNISTGQVQEVITQLNDLYSSNTNIHFYLICDISIINNGNYANNGEQYFNDYTLVNKTAGAINVHFVIQSGANWAGKANFPFPFFGLPNPRAYSCAVETSLWSIPSIVSILGHEIGHNLGLYHTHHPGRNNQHSKNEDCGDCYQESVSRTRTQGAVCVSTIGQKKCEVNGDFLCDTAADPALSWKGRRPEYYVASNCDYLSSSGGTDNWGDTWIPNTNNIMSYTRLTCMGYFSPLQLGKMYGFISAIGTNYPAFTITGPANLCNGQTANYSVNTLPGVTNYTWSVPSNLTILSGQGSNSINVLACTGNGGTITVMPNCGNKPATRTISSINFVPINGLDAACPGQTYTYSTPPLSGASYNWTAVENASIVSGQGTNSVQVLLNNGFTNQSYISVAVSNYCTTTIYGNKIIAHADPVFPEPPCFVIDPIAPRIESVSKSVSLKLQDMHLNPNPASSRVTIIVPDEAIYDLVLFNMAGQTIYRKNKAVHKQQVLNIQEFSAGIYFVCVISGDKSYSKKLIIKK
ncbi:MAG: T9SS type A sorting domain-containing protein [Rickettsiaceae bacterium]|nr:T9SS type A sorting domain-containing protein [Rickettsiaceae bacterium]